MAPLGGLFRVVLGTRRSHVQVLGKVGDVHQTAWGNTTQARLIFFHHPPVCVLQLTRKRRKTRFELFFGLCDQRGRGAVCDL